MAEPKTTPKSCANCAHGTGPDPTDPWHKGKEGQINCRRPRNEYGGKAGPYADWQAPTNWCQQHSLKPRSQR